MHFPNHYILVLQVSSQARRPEELSDQDFIDSH